MIKIIAEHQLQQRENKSKKYMNKIMLSEKLVEGMIYSSMQNLQELLNEPIDHGIIVEKNIDGKIFYKIDHFFNKTITVVNGCSSGVDAIYTIDSVGAWANSCGSVGKFKDIVNATPGADSSQYCNAGNGDFLRIIPNTVCFENHTNDTSSIVAISKGTLNGSNGSGVIIRILNKIENKEFESWNFSY